MTQFHGFDHFFLIFPVLCFHEKAKVKGCQSCAATLSSTRMNVYNLTLFHKMVQGFGCLKKIVNILIAISINKWEAHIVFDSFLMVPLLDLVLIYTPSSHLSISHQVKNCTNLSFLRQLFYIYLIEREWAQNNVLKCSTFVNLVEEPSLQESAVSLFDNTIDDIDVVLNMPMMSV